MKFLKIILPVMSIGLLVACSSGSDSSGSSQIFETFCGGSLEISRGPAAPNEALVRATVLGIRSDTTGTLLNLYITESHTIGNENNAVKVNTEIEVRTGQILDINVNDTITAFVSLVGDECGAGLFISNIVKMPSATDTAPDTMTVTVSGQSGTVTTTTYTEGPCNAQGNLDPDLISYVTASTLTRIQLHSGGTYTPGATVLSIMIEGITPQPYTLGGVNPITSISYDVIGTGSFFSRSGTVTLSSIGNVGAKIIGDFDAVFTDLKKTSTLRISGTFSVTRDN